MYPMNLFAMFPPFPRKDTVFVAMSFDERFNHRWNNVIRPGIQRISSNDNRLEPLRIDERNISDSIMTEILIEISHARLVFADISSVGKVGDRMIRNGNVMYEVGLAQAVRLPEEVILVRSDEDYLLFDVQGVRVNKYSPEDDPKIAIDIVAGLVLEALKQVELAKTLAVKQVLEKLDFQGWFLLTQGAEGVIKYPQIRTMRDVLSYGTSRYSALLRLLDLGLVKMCCEKITVDKLKEGKEPQPEELFTYKTTEFGLAVLKAYGISAGIHELPSEFMESLNSKSSNKSKNSFEDKHQDK